MCLPLSCVKIQKITNMLTLGQIKLYTYGACEQESEKKSKFCFFEYTKLDFVKKKLLVQKKNIFLLRFYVYQKKRLDE